MRKPRVKIRTVADAAGVSVTTVSLVLNNVASARDGADTRRRVQEAAERLGYVPNEVARQLRAQRTNTLGLLGDEVTLVGTVEVADDEVTAVRFVLNPEKLGWVHAP